MFLIAKLNIFLLLNKFLHYFCKQRQSLSTMQIIKNIFTAILRTLFPRRCIFCFGILRENEDSICNNCRNLYPFPQDCNIKDFFAPLYPYISGICIMGTYSYCKKAILDFKGKENFRYGNCLCSLLCDKLQNQTWINDIDIIVPVPLHKKRLAERGFNQSQVIAQVIAKQFGKPVVSNNLYRTKYSLPQHKLPAFKRYENTQNIFQTKDASAFEDKTVLLVDDVITTCATVAQCCKALFKSQGIKIYVCALASERNLF